MFATVKFPITDPNGLVTGMGGATTDITERRRALDSLKAEQELLRRTLEEQDRERQLIVYAVHDGLMQYAAGALMQLQSLELPPNNPAAQTLVESVIADLRRTVNEGRQLINGIRTPVLDDLGVVAALEQLIEEEDRAHVQVEFVKDDYPGADGSQGRRGNISHRARGADEYSQTQPGQKRARRARAAWRYYSL